MGERKGRYEERIKEIVKEMERNRQTTHFQSAVFQSERLEFGDFLLALFGFDVGLLLPFVEAEDGAFHARHSLPQSRDVLTELVPSSAVVSVA